MSRCGTTDSRCSCPTPSRPLPSPLFPTHSCAIAWLRHIAGLQTTFDQPHSLQALDLIQTADQSTVGAALHFQQHVLAEVGISERRALPTAAALSGRRGSDSNQQRSEERWGQYRQPRQQQGRLPRFAATVTAIRCCCGPDMAAQPRLVMSAQMSPACTAGNRNANVTGRAVER